jgi:hypothetical protein
MPGPGQYGNPVLKENLGGKFNLSNPKSDVDWMVPPPPPNLSQFPTKPPFFFVFRYGGATNFPRPANTATPAKRRA